MTRQLLTKDKPGYSKPRPVSCIENAHALIAFFYPGCYKHGSSASWHWVDEDDNLLGEAWMRNREWYFCFKEV